MTHAPGGVVTQPSGTTGIIPGPTTGPRQRGPFFVGSQPWGNCMNVVGSSAIGLRRLAIALGLGKPGALVREVTCRPSRRSSRAGHWSLSLRRRRSGGDPAARAARWGRPGCGCRPTAFRAELVQRLTGSGGWGLPLLAQDDVRAQPQRGGSRILISASARAVRKHGRCGCRCTPVGSRTSNW